MSPLKPVMRRLHDQERGATVVIVALSLIALFGMIVLVMDVGGLLFKRRELVNGADASALAFAQTCALDVATDPSDPQVQGDTAAIANVNGLVTGNVIYSVNGVCTSVDRGPSGYVIADAAMPQDLFFAPVLGFGDQTTVSAEATAAWGVLGGGHAVPIVLESSQFQGPCDVPDNVNIGDNCNFWYNNGNFAIGAANWGFLNLDQWDVDVDHNCSSTGGAADRADYIREDYPTTLPLAEPGPTYVCSMTGHATSNWDDLMTRMNCDYDSCPGTTLLMPVNDCDRQVDKDGNPVVCGSGTPDKFAIIGFTSLEISGIYRGDDPLAIGTPGTAAQTNDCGSNGTDLNLSALGDVRLNVVATNSCGAPSSVDSIPSGGIAPFSPVAVTRKEGSVTTTFVKCPPIGGTGCDYRYNEDPVNVVGGLDPFELQWVNAATRSLNNKMVNFTWHVDGTAGEPGFCGIQTSDPNAICLVTTWQGYTADNSIIIDGPDFGAHGYILCDFDYDSCPAGLSPPP